MKDKDIVNETTSSIIMKFHYYMNNKNTINYSKKNKLIDYYFVHKNDENDINNLYHKLYLKREILNRIEKFLNLIGRNQAAFTSPT